MAVIDLYKFTELELIYRSKVKASERPKVTNSQEAYTGTAKPDDETIYSLNREIKKHHKVNISGER